MQNIIDRKCIIQVSSFLRGLPFQKSNFHCKLGGRLKRFHCIFNCSNILNKRRCVINVDVLFLDNLDQTSSKCSQPTFKAVFTDSLQTILKNLMHLIFISLFNGAFHNRNSIIHKCLQNISFYKEIISFTKWIINYFTQAKGINHSVWPFSLRHNPGLHMTNLT